MNLEKRVSKLELIKDLIKIPGKFNKRIWILPDEKDLYSQFLKWLKDHPEVECYHLVVERSDEKKVFDKKRNSVFNDFNLN